MKRRWPISLRRVPVAMLGVLVAACAAGMLWPYDAGADVDMSRSFGALSWEHPLGTDWLGRDLLHRLVTSTRAFFLPGAVATVIALSLGVSLGAVAGYVPHEGHRPQGKAWKTVATAPRKLVTLLLTVPGTLPRFVTIALCSAAWGFGAFLLASVAGVLYAAELGEDVRMRVTTCAREEYVESARATGVSELRILGHHILYLQTRRLIVSHLIHLWSFVILAETSLSFMPGEYGVQEPQPSWGNMLVGAREGAMLGHFWPAAAPTLALLFSVIALTWIGDTLDGSMESSSSSQAGEPAAGA